MTPHRRRLRRGLAAALLAATWPAQALQLQLAGADLDGAHAEAGRQVLEAALRRLPPAWLAAPDRTITVEFRDDLPARVHGRARGDRIVLDRALLAGWMAGGPAPVEGTQARPAPALAALVHELAHVHDRAAGGGISGDRRLLDLAGWQVGPLWSGLRTSANAFSDRSPDRYELASPAEFFAVNMEYFLLDPEYACRRPALHRYFSTRLGHAPPAADCAPGLAFLQPTAGPGQPALLQLDPARVYEVDYLLAEGNDRLMSRWGHSMLRLVICAPGRPPGPACRLDLQHHRVLSFRAFVDDVQVSSWRGLTGSYPSRLFVLPLAQVVEEYTKIELRGLQSVPLRLQRAEIAGLLERAARLHWSYDGRYYFVSNNCAVETFKLLHDGVPRLATAGLGSITPTGLLRRLRKAGIADTGVLADRTRALRLGYYFEAASAHYQALFDVADQALQLPVDGVQAWLDLAPAERAPLLPRAQLRAAAALLLLENAALRRQQLLARDELKRRLFDGGRGDDPGAIRDARAALGALLELEGALGRPASLLPGAGYGLPQGHERDALDRIAGERSIRLREDAGRLLEQARRWLSPQRQAALEAGEANVALLGARLRELNRDNALQLTRPSAP